MDSNRFDDLTRGLTSASSRRTALKTLAAGALSLGLAKSAVAEAADAVEPAGCKVRRCKKAQFKDRCKSNHECCGGLKCKNKKCKFKNGHGKAGDWCNNDRDCQSKFFCKKNQCIPNSCRS
ncbi:MAG TPA: hypothetical protein VFI22_04035 [Thermomicrobiales bacterium]|nr:hypothetical protein [Thermomicrobiales bacterium]